MPEPFFADPPDPVNRLMQRRRFIQTAGAGTVVAAIGAYYALSDDLTRQALASTRKDGRPRLPPGQRALRRLKPMGGRAGNPSPGAFRLRVHGLVQRPLELDYSELLRLPQSTRPLDVHCVTGWSALGLEWTGVKLRDILARAKVQKQARYAIIEAAHGYTANLPLQEALKDNALVAYKLEGRSLQRAHGSPVRAVIPDLYFWKSAKWLTGIKLVRRDAPGYWESRGYHNRGDPWREERYG